MKKIQASEAARFKLASSYPWAALSALVVLDRSRLESVGEMDSVVAVSGDYERVHAGLPPASNLVFFPYTYPSSPCELSSSEASVDCLSMHLATEIGLGAPLCSWQSHARTKAQEARRMVQWLAPMRQHVLTADNTAGSPFRSGELYSLHCVEWFDSMVELILRTNVVFGGVDFTHKLEQLSIEPNASIVAVVLAAHVLLPPGSVLDDVSGSWVYHPYEFHLADPPGAMAEAAKLFPSCLPAALHSAQPILRRVMRSVTGDEPLIVSVDDGVTRACDQN